MPKSKPSASHFLRPEEISKISRRRRGPTVTVRAHRRTLRLVLPETLRDRLWASVDDRVCALLTHIDRSSGYLRSVDLRRAKRLITLLEDTFMEHRQ